MAPPPGTSPMKKPRNVPREMGPDGVFPVLKVRKEILELCRNDLPLDFRLQVLEHFGDAEKTHDERNKPHPIGQDLHSIGKTVSSR